MGALADQAKKMSSFLKVLPGEPVSVLYKGWKTVPSRLDPDKEVFRYFLEVDGQKKTWDNGKTSIAMVFDHCNDGDIVEISNSGTEEKGVYSVKILVGANAAEQPQESKPSPKKDNPAGKTA